MRYLSTRISERLYQQLKAKGQEMGLTKKRSMSKIVRTLLSSAIENPQSDFNDKVQNKILDHTITIYYLLREYIRTQLGEDGSKINNLAHDKSEKALEAIFKK